ncbi:preprotein translocase subunit SecG [Candidatus Kuenenbacteria bacterium]|nr:preprotein translocase subunit SecG [Candidatus Kuenenbacteria bacterium]
MKFLNILQFIVSLLLIISILLQSKGSGLGAAFGGGGENIYQTKRGIEKSLFIFTIILSILFLGLGIVNIVLIK